MALTTLDAYGAPSYGAIGRPPAGVVFHTPENADATLASAKAIALWQAGSTNTSGGSYHGILGHNTAIDSPVGCKIADHWTMVRSVPWDQAAGSISGNHTPPSQGGAWDPGRYPWIAQLLGAAAYADPNKWLHAIALSGKAAWYVTNGYPPGAVKRLAEWVLTLEKAYGYDAVMTLHRMWQTNRSDPGNLDLGDLVMVEYNKLVAPAPAPVPTPAPTPAPAPVVTYTKAQLDAAVAAAKTAATAAGRVAGIKAAAAAAAATK